MIYLITNIFLILYNILHSRLWVEKLHLYVYATRSELSLAREFKEGLSLSAMDASTSIKDSVQQKTIAIIYTFLTFSKGKWVLKILNWDPICYISQLSV